MERYLIRLSGAMIFPDVRVYQLMPQGLV